MSAFHARSLTTHYKALMLNGVVLARKTDDGALKRPVLVALGITGDEMGRIISARKATTHESRLYEEDDF